MCGARGGGRRAKLNRARAHRGAAWFKNRSYSQGRRGAGRPGAEARSKGAPPAPQGRDPHRQGDGAWGPWGFFITPQLISSQARAGPPSCRAAALCCKRCGLACLRAGGGGAPARPKPAPDRRGGAAVRGPPKPA